MLCSFLGSISVSFSFLPRQESRPRYGIYPRSFNGEIAFAWSFYILIWTSILLLKPFYVLTSSFTDSFRSLSFFFLSLYSFFTFALPSTFTPTPWSLILVFKRSSFAFYLFTLWISLIFAYRIHALPSKVHLVAETISLVQDSFFHF